MTLVQELGHHKCAINESSVGMDHGGDGSGNDTAQHCFLTTSNRHHHHHYLHRDSNAGLPKHGIATGESGL